MRLVLVVGLDELCVRCPHPQLRRWPQFHIARAGLPGRQGRAGEAIVASRAALELEPPPASRSFITRRIKELENQGTSGRRRPGSAW